ncbi:MAG: HEAT repeat domain-containing protein [Verrucomicrobiia bacterium]
MQTGCFIANHEPPGEFNLKGFMKKLVKSLLSINVALIIGFQAYCQSHKAETNLPENFSQVVKQASSYQSGSSMEPLREIETIVVKCKGNTALKNKVETALEQIINNPLSTIEAKKFACQQLAIIGPVNSLKSLGKLASVELTSGFACMALVNSPSTKAASETLSKAYRDGNLTAKIQIINAIGNLRQPSSILFLKQILAENQPQIVESALFALGKIGTKEATDAILQLNSNQRNDYGVAVADALLLCAEKAASEQRREEASKIYDTIFNTSDYPFYIKRAAFLGLVKTDKDGGALRVEKTLIDKDSNLKPVAISLIPTLKGSGISRKFSKILPSLSTSEQALLVDALARIGDDVAISTIQNLATSPVAEVKFAAITALGNIGNKKQVGLLLKALSETSSPDESRIIETALASLKGGEKTDMAIAGGLQKSAPEIKVRIINVLGRRYAVTTIPQILREATSPEASVSRAAFKVLSRMCSDKHISSLVDALINLKSPQVRGEVENAVAAVIERTEDKKQCEYIVCEQLSSVKDADIKVSLINLLPVCGGKKAFEMAKAAYSNSNPKLKEAALRAICEWRDISAWDTLVKIYESPDSDSYRVLALRGLTRLLGEENIRPDAELVSKYERLIKGAKSDSDKKLILGALSGCHHPEALYLALELVKEPSLKFEAIEAVKKIAGAIQNKYPKEVSDALGKIK